MLLVAATILASPSPIFAQQAQTPAAGPGAQTPVEEEEDDAVLNPAEPDFVIVNLPTTMRLPLYKGNFRLTHRFVGNLRAGSFSDQASTLFGIDQGAVIGFEYRIALWPGLQAAAYRSSFDRTIQLYAKHDALRQRDSWMPAVSGLVSIEGTNNFQEEYAPALGAVLSRTMADRVAAYAVPVWIHNSAATEAASHTHDPAETEDHEHADRNTFYLGLGGRLRVLSTVYFVGEVIPRLAGYAPNEVAYGFGVEKRVGSHMFSLTFTNSFNTTFAQMARGGTANSLYLGFNLGRKFF